MFLSVVLPGGVLGCYILIKSLGWFPNTENTWIPIRPGDNPHSPFAFAFALYVIELLDINVR